MKPSSLPESMLDPRPSAASRLAYRRGRHGNRYILGGENVSFREIVRRSLKAFRMRRPLFSRDGTRVKGLRVLVVDDVSTTGSTLDACAAVLKEEGAAEVFALTAARVPTRC